MPAPGRCIPRICGVVLGFGSEKIPSLPSDFYRYKLNSWEHFDVIDVIPLHQPFLSQHKYIYIYRVLGSECAI